MRALREIGEKMEKDSLQIVELDQSLYNLTDPNCDSTSTISLYENLFKKIYLNGNVYEYERDRELVEYEKLYRRYDILSG